MKAYSVIAHGIYALIVIALAVFIVAGLVPTKMDGMPLDVELGAECEYKVTEDTKVLEYNISDAVNYNGTDALVYVGSTYVATVTKGSSYSVTSAVSKLQTEHPSETATLWKNKGDGTREKMKQSLILKETDGITMDMYTEVWITNYLRYNLQDISVKVSQVSKSGDSRYLIADTPTFTVPPEDTYKAPVNIEINYIDSAMLMLANEKDSMKISLTIDIAGKYMAGIADGNISVATSFAPAGIPTVTVTENKISATSQPIPLIPMGMNVTAKVGGVDIAMENKGTGFKVDIDAGTEKIIDALRESYESGNYTITYNDGGGDKTITLTKEEYKTMIDMAAEVMETYGKGMF